MDTRHFLWESVVEIYRLRYNSRGLERTYFAAILESEIKGETRDALCFTPGGNLQALHDTRETLVLETRVLSFRILADDGKINVGVVRWGTTNRLANDY